MTAVSALIGHAAWWPGHQERTHALSPALEREPGVGLQSDT
ncbi:hypothetical protein [Gaiella sp.]|nr:hypothetical protein [Gaiella sp.]HEX5583781.1 hypothetical protein [Gaiella sp.]